MTTTPKTAKAAAPKNPAKVSHAKTKTPAAELPTISSVKLVPLALIDIAPQVRTVFDEDSIRELADDILARGLLQPVLLNPHGARFTLIAGERRFRACRLAELSDIPALVTKASAADALLMQLAENIQREDLELQDQVRTVRLLHDNLGTVTAVAETVKKSAGWVSKRLALSHPDLCYQARSLMEDGITEDVEILNILSQLDAISWHAAQTLAQQLRAGTATRETARQTLKDAKNPKPPKIDPEQEQRDQEHQARAERANAERAAARKEATEGTGEPFLAFALDELNDHIMYQDEDPAAFLNQLSDPQRAALLAHLVAIQTAAPGWTAIQWAAHLSDCAGEDTTYLEQLAAVLALRDQKIADCYSFVTLAWGAHGGKENQS